MVPGPIKPWRAKKTGEQVPSPTTICDPSIGQVARNPLDNGIRLFTHVQKLSLHIRAETREVGQIDVYIKV